MRMKPGQRTISITSPTTGYTNRTKFVLQSYAPRTPPPPHKTNNNIKPKRESLKVCYIHVQTLKI